MTALTAPRKTGARGDTTPYNFTVGAAARIFQGGLVILISGYAAAGQTAGSAGVEATYSCVGVSFDTVAGNGVDGGVSVNVAAGEFPFANSSSADLITIASIGAVAYVVDDQTVAKTSNSGVRCIAGRITGVDPDGTVWVRVGPGLAA